MQILKIIESRPTIHHRWLLGIISKKKLMAKATAEKYLKELIQEKEIVAHKYGKEKEYVLSKNNSNEKNIDDQYQIWLIKLKEKINQIEKDYKKYNYYTKLNFIDYLERLHESLSENLTLCLKYQFIEKLENIDEERLIIDEIKDIIGNPKTKSDREKILLVYSIFDKIIKIKHEYASNINNLRTTHVSKKRMIINRSAFELEQESSKLLRELERIRDQLKSTNNQNEDQNS